MRVLLGGLHARALLGPDLRADAAIPALFVELFSLRPWPDFLGIAILSAIVSTADGLFVSIAVNFQQRFIPEKTFARRYSPAINRSRKLDRFCPEISPVWLPYLRLLAAIAIAWNPPQFLAVLLWIGVGGIMSGAAGPLLIGSVWRRSTPAAAHCLVSHRRHRLWRDLRNHWLAESLCGSRGLYAAGQRGYGGGQPVYQAHARRQAQRDFLAGS